MTTLSARPRTDSFVGRESELATATLESLVHSTTDSSGNTGRVRFTITVKRS
jgi:hypothetical protein